MQSGIVYRGCRIVPPLSMRNTILQQMHTGHPGICRMLRLARQYVWWPSIDADVNAFVQHCATCQMNARKRTNAKLASWEDAEDFFERIHIDVAFYRNHSLSISHYNGNCGCFFSLGGMPIS